MVFRRTTWLVAVPMLLAFTAFAYLSVAGTTQSQSDALAEAIAKEPMLRTSAEFVAFANDGAAASSFKRTQRVCAISRRQVRRLQRKYDVDVIRMRVGGRRVKVYLVHDVDSDAEIRRTLHIQHKRCKLVHRGQIYFLPFSPQLS
ncbi:MAG: hypothetical protein QOJ38_1799 [Solirubrobacterales bacterium]|nr:hypothetical protein [Solirubrobacterales bacterium]